MLILNLDKEFQKINAQYPWASNQTLSSILDDMVVDIKSKAKALKILEKNDTGVTETLNEFHKLSNKYGRLIDLSARKMRNIGEGVMKTARSTDPIEGVANLTKLGGGALESAGAGLGNFGGTLGKNFKAAGTGLSGVGTASVTFASIISIYGALINEQEKSMRSMIDYGLVASDVGLYTDMRDAFAHMGMSLNEGVVFFKDLYPVFAQLGDDNLHTLEGFTETVSSGITDKTISRYGRTQSDAMRSIAEEVRIMYNYNQISELNNISMTKVLDRYNNSSKITTALSSIMGVKRDVLEQSRIAALSDLDFQTAYIQNEAAIIDAIGTDGAAYLLAARQSISSGFSAMLGDDFTSLTDDALTRAIYDYENNNDFYDNMGEELNTILNLLGADSRKIYMDMMQGVLDGGLDATGIETVKRDFIKSLRNPSADVPALESAFNIPTSELLIARELVDRAILVSDDYVNMSDSDLAQITNSVDEFTDRSDDAIEVVDNMRAAMRNIYDLIAPGFKSTTIAIDLFSGMLTTLQSSISVAVSALSKDRELGQAQKSFKENVAAQRAALETGLPQQAFRETVVAQRAAFSDTNLRSQAITVFKENVAAQRAALETGLPQQSFREKVAAQKAAHAARRAERIAAENAVTGDLTTSAVANLAELEPQPMSLAPPTQAPLEQQASPAPKYPTSWPMDKTGVKLRSEQRDWLLKYGDEYNKDGTKKSYIHPTVYFGNDKPNFDGIRGDKWWNGGDVHVFDGTSWVPYEAQAPWATNEAQTPSNPAPTLLTSVDEPTNEEQSIKLIDDSLAAITELRNNAATDAKTWNTISQCDNLDKSKTAAIK